MNRPAAEFEPASHAEVSKASTASHACAPAEPRRQRTPAACLCSDDLLRGNNSVDICHNGAVYRLQQTRAGKLILTK